MKKHLFCAFAAALALAAASLPGQALACACGCDVFDVGASALFPSGHGQGGVFSEYDYMDQTHDWSGHSGAPSADNSDKEIQTSFLTLGGQYMFHCGLGVMVEATGADRTFRTDDGAGVQSFTHLAFGDLKLMGVYAGFSSDMSSGVIFGLKLPTGDFRYAGFDRDTEIGSGSTDLLLGAYHRGDIGRSGRLGYYAQILWQAPLAYQGGYRPGQDINGAVGVSYKAFSNLTETFRITPVMQLVVSTRTRDAGPAADPPNSGYERLLLSPGVQVDVNKLRLYGDVEFPVYQRVNGDQLVAPTLFKFIVSRSF